ncbi:MAG: [citrate (pro-3S)-lyase] ligase [Streptococcaceae bacterium]|jgi:[citrate (pro-3S)-lyase] ligase|nr:[citrate (pro-3S)-lyase] ligase [Streptococcaceae bacterium]
MSTAYIFKQLWLNRDQNAYKQWAELLKSGGLGTDEVLDYTIGLFDENELIATGSFSGNIIKNVVVCKRYNGENLLTQIIMKLMDEMRERGFWHLMLYTKIENVAIFKSLGFSSIIKNETLAFMEFGHPNFEDYLSYLQKEKKSEESTGIVMNANPFTLGHQYLVEDAAKISKQVYIFVVSEDVSEISFKDRFQMVQLGTKHLSNVKVLETREYMVSSATFPSYFLKDKAQLAVAKTQAMMDAKLFLERIAPTLNITQRFVGEEPFSPVTNIYNEAMKEYFGEKLKLTILPRKQIQGEAISATRVRKALVEKNEELLNNFLPKTSLNYLKEEGKLEWN